MRVLVQWLCGLRKKHHFVQKVDNMRRRIYVECVLCGKEWRGLQITGSPKKRF
jgi:hypothetical protein